MGTVPGPKRLPASVEQAHGNPMSKNIVPGKRQVVVTDVFEGKRPGNDGYTHFFSPFTFGILGVTSPVP